MTRLWWVRHGPTHAKTFTGWRDIPADLSDTAAILRLNAFLPQGALLVSSDLSRARDTAQTLASGRQALPEDPALREFDFGAWDGLHFSEVSEKWPELSRAYWESPGDIAPPDGESWNAAATRLNTATDLLLQQHAGRDIILVAHFGAILTQFQRAANLTPYAALAQRIEPLSVSCFCHSATGWQVDLINHIP